MSKAMVGAFAILVAVAVGGPGVAAQTGDNGEIDLSVGWVTSANDLNGAIGAHPDLGVVLVGSAGEFPPVPPPAWYSADGVSFDRIEFPSPVGDPIVGFDVAANDDGFVAIVSVPFASFSSDGRTWQPIQLDDSAGCTMAGVGEEDAGPNPCAFRFAAAGPSGFVLVGSSECDAFALYSADGKVWSRSADFPKNCAPLGVVATEEGFAAFGAPDLTMTSVDGASWLVTTGTGLPKDLGNYRDARFGVIGDTLALLGTKSGPNCDFLPGSWYSTDGGATWTEGAIEPVGDPAPDDAGFQPEDIVLTDFGLVAVGPLVSDPLCGPNVEPGDSGLILVSQDGITWRQFTNDFAIRNVAATSTGLIGTGSIGVATWAPGRDGLPDTGAGTAPLLIAAGALIAMGTMLITYSQRRRRTALMGGARES